MQSDVDAIVNWTADNHLRLNPDKIKAIKFDTAIQLNKLNEEEIPSIIVSNVTIDNSSSALNLGVILTPTLNWSLHIMKLSKSMHYALHRLHLKSRLLS